MDDIIARLERYSTTVPFTGCWLWLGADVSNAGYGRLVINGKRHSIHRLSFKAHYGDPGTKFVLHKCDVRLCWNPSHLFQGDQKANMVDKSRKGRCADRHGSKHPLAKLSDDDVKEIRRLYAAGSLQRKIGELFSIGQDQVSRIVAGKCWRQ
jgi:hypothetical protein